MHVRPRAPRVQRGTAGSRGGQAHSTVWAEASQGTGEQGW